MATLTQTVNRLPVRDQLALRLLGYAVQGGTAPDDAAEAVRRSYDLADAFMVVARENWRLAQAAAKGEAAETDEADDAQDQSAAA